MSTKEIANKLVSYCREGKYQACYDELYAEDIWSIEPEGAFFEKAHGFEELKAKGQAWNENIEEFHGSDIGDPIVSGSHFSCTMMIDCTFKDIGRQRMEQICVYEVKNSKITKEQFFYSLPNC